MSRHVSIRDVRAALAALERAGNVDDGDLRQPGPVPYAYAVGYARIALRRALGLSDACETARSPSAAAGGDAGVTGASYVPLEIPS